jgi:hypothetical protein
MGTMRLGLAAAVLALLASAAGAAPCTSSATALCLSSGRFEVKVAWTDFQGKTGDGQAVALTADTGYFWFFNSSNIELIVKVLDARGINQKFWVFFGALSNVEYTLTVTDSTTGVVKRYQNPSGQFASVGDTTAFDGVEAMPAASQQTVIAAGTAAPPASMAEIQRFIDSASATSAFVPCPEESFGFSLTGCRFHIEVEWDDGHGQTGFGQPVQLTTDTGYFWFFSPSNVELMVKVLDARPIDGNFWVFFGALSNVAYTVAVRDTVTGSLKTYRNASGSFASVGDTSAFRGGYSVAPVVDSGNASSADMDPAGGTVTATGADGTVFILELPPQALPRPETITLTPVSRIDHFPFSGGLAAGVEIEPSGLALLLPATLTIQPASAPPADRALPYSYSPGGEDFILYPRDPDSSSLRLPLVKFGGYGVGLGGATDAANQADRIPTATLSPYLQRYAHETYRHSLGLVTRTQLADSAIQIYRQAYSELVAPLLNPTGAAATEPSLAAKAETCVLVDRDGHEYNPKEGLLTWIGIAYQRRMTGAADADEAESEIDGVLDALKACFYEAFNKCLTNSDPYAVLFMLDLVHDLQSLGVDDPRLTAFTEDSLLDRCLRFELDFESKLVEEANRSGVAGTERLKYRSQHVPLRFSYGGNDYAPRAIFAGACSLVPEVATYDYVSDRGSRCTVATTPHSGWFAAAAAWIGLGLDPSQLAVDLLYYPGDPRVTATITCDQGGNLGDFPITPFIDNFGWFHEGDVAAGYVGTFYWAKHWDHLRFRTGPSQNDQYFAKKSYERSIPESPVLTLREETIIFLKHTPDAPMPECPEF